MPRIIAPLFCFFSQAAVSKKHAKKGSTENIKFSMIFINSCLSIFYCNSFSFEKTALKRRVGRPSRPVLSVTLLLFLSIFGLAEAVSGQGIGKTVRISNPSNKTLTEIDLPDSLYATRKTLLVFYALPNGNSIEWTKGKRISGTDDWHFDIQHIKAQTVFLRSVMTDCNLAVAYMANSLKSWPAWKREAPGRPAEIRRLVDSIAGSLAPYHPRVMLNSHSGGGSFIFGYLDAVDEIPDNIQRIAFIDSDYGYEDSMHTRKLAHWLKHGKHYLTVLAYNDSVVIFNGKPLVSPTGGTWYRSKLLQRNLAKEFRFKSEADTAFITSSALSNRIDIRLKTNPNAKIYHTEQVARNGFIHTVIGGTKYARKARYAYWGERVYGAFIPE
jgi:hypothetical protein